VVTLVPPLLAKCRKLLITRVSNLRFFIKIHDDFFLCGLMWGGGGTEIG
jgi:hypothetical protein